MPIRRWDKSRPPTGPYTLNRDAPQARGLVAWWPMGGRATRSLLIDEAGNFNLSGTTTRLDIGPTGAPVCVFNGTSDVASTSSAPVTSMPLTLAGWATAGSASLVGSILSIDAGLASFASANFYRLVVVGSASPKQVRANQGKAGSEAQATYGAGWVAGREFHVAGVFTSTTSREVYYNGALGASDSTSLAAPTVSQSVLGRHSVTGSEQYWSGSLGEAGAWSVALPAHIVARLYDPGTRFELWYPLRSRKWMWMPLSGGGASSADLAATGASGTLSASAYTQATAALAATGGSGIFVGSAFSSAVAAAALSGGTGTFSGTASSPAVAALAATGASGSLVASAGTGTSADLAATGASGALSATAYTPATAALTAAGASGALSASAAIAALASLGATGGSATLALLASVGAEYVRAPEQLAVAGRTRDRTLTLSRPRRRVGAVLSEP